MPAKGPNQTGYHHPLNRSRTPMEPGPGSAGTPHSLETSYNRSQDSVYDTDYLAATTQPETTPATAPTDGSFVGNNANQNVHFGTGGIVNNNPNMNFHPGSNANVIYAPVNYAPINNFNNFMVPEGHVPDHADNQEKIINAIMTLIGDRFISDALYDTQPKHAGCMLGTRESVLAGIERWIRQDPTRIFWLAGMAGTGKTSIAVTLCRILSNDPTVMLAGSFFCSRSAGSIARTEVRNILPTLAATLATQYPEFAVALAAGLKEDPRVTQKPVSDQLQMLLVRPFEMIASLTCPVILVIDALDECSDEREVGELLTAIADLKINPSVKFVVTSRPEMHIRGTPISNPDHNTILQLHNIKEEEVTIDIRRYVIGTLEASTTATILGAGWFTNADVETLVRLSNGLFIFVSTVLAYILAREQPRGRKERLHKVTYAATHGSTAAAPLDKIYEMIIIEAARSDFVDVDELRATQRVLATVLASRTPLSVTAMADLLDTDVEDVRGSLERLHSVIHVPADDNVPGVRVLHASFGDYVVSRAADRVRLPATLGDEVLARGCLHVMSRRLCFNISQSRSSYQPNPKTKPNSFTLSLEYACLEWIYHIANLENPSDWDQDISEMFCVRFLFWLEVMSMMNKVLRAAAMLRFAAVTVRFSQVKEFLHDASRFVASSSKAIERAAPHIYLSALPFADKGSIVYRTFAPLCKGLISVEAIGVDQHGGRLMMTLTGHSNRVRSVDCSSDGHLIISGSDDGTIRIWDIRTGEETMPPLNCGGGFVLSVAFAPNGKIFSASTLTGGVFTWSLSAACANLQWRYPSVVSTRSVSFSPDGSLVASGFGNGIVRLWHVETGKVFAVLYCGHKDVTTVAFSPDGATIASVSGSSGMIQLWLVATSEPLGRPFEGTLQSSKPICFSPGGTILAVPGRDGCIELLEINNWSIIATIGRGTGNLSHMRFSPGGQSITSASDNGDVYLSTIPVEKVESSLVVFNGHASRVRGTTFSHDGLYIVSCSDDHTIRVWHTGGRLDAVQTVPAHTDGITSVATATDGTFIVSGSYDGSVRVWDAHTGSSRLAPLLGHTEPVLSVAISQDRRMIASASTDETVRLWDSRNGRAIGNPLKGHESVINSVAFSPGTRWLASGSEDRTVRIWDVATERQAVSSQLNCSEAVHAVAFSPDERLIAAGESYGRVHIWHTGTWQPFRTFNGDGGEDLRSIAFTPDCTRIVCGVGRGGKVAMRDISLREEPFARPFTSSSTERESFAPRFASISTEDEGLAFRLTSISMEDEGLASRSVAGFVGSVTVAHQGTLICSGMSDEKCVCIQDATTGGSIIKLEGHTSAVNSLALQPDGKSLVSCSDDRTIRVWDLTVARELSSSDYDDPTKPLTFTRLQDGWLVSSSEDLLLWVPPEYRKHLPIWPCTLLIAEKCVNITVGNAGWHRGTSWTSCWLEDAWKDISRS